MVGLAAYVWLSQGGAKIVWSDNWSQAPTLSTELQQWNPNARMPAIDGLSDDEIRARIQSSIKSFEDIDREHFQRRR
jgi:hypothetical protein